MSLTTCLKKMGAAISPKDKAAILSLASGYRSQGLDPTAAAIQAVSDQAEIAQSRLAELSTADRQVESTPLPSKRADTPQTETENFKRWFAGSKVVDSEGKPLVVYHGTKGDFDVFGGTRDDGVLRVRSGVPGGSDVGAPGGQFWFTTDPQLAFANGEAGSSVMPVYVRIENPIRRSGYFGMDDFSRPEKFKYFDKSKQEWVTPDGVIGDNGVVVAFRPEQIKSAIGNNGDFDPSKPSILASKRTRQDAEKDAEPTPRFNSATEFWTNNIGKPLFNMISRATKSVVANDFLKRHGLNLAEDMPPEAQKAWREYKQDVGNLKKTVSEIADEAKNLSPEERAMVSDLVEREMKAGVTPPEAVIRMATLMTSIMRKQSQQLVETGMLSKDAADRWEGRYLPRFYQKHLLTNPFDTMLRKAYLSGIKGTHLKGRGLFETIRLRTFLPTRKWAGKSAIQSTARSPT
jgi:hypothetical protein